MSMNPNSSICKPLRPYQSRLVAQAADSNSIVMLPTGSGKTAIAGEVIRQRMRPGFKALFLVPTCILVDQQARALREWCGLHIGEFMGGHALPTNWDVLVSTPKAFLCKQVSVPALDWSHFGLIVFDEVHHVLKQHPYRKIALSLKALPESGAPQILGLSASLTYAVTAQKVNAALDKLCQELRVRVMLTASTDELARDGYQGNSATPELALDLTAEDSASGSMPKGPPPETRKPHLMHSIFFNRIAQNATSQFTHDLVQLVRTLEELIKADDSSFHSPLSQSSLKEWGTYAHTRSRTGRFAAMYADLEHFYEAIRLLVTSWEESEDLAAYYLLMTLGGSSRSAWSVAGQRAIGDFWIFLTELEFPRFERLKRVLLSKVNASFRGIVFVQQRLTTHIVQHFIEQDGDLSPLLQCATIYATKTPATASFSVSPSESKERLASFSTGAINLLVATVVAEEGMDVPAANAVIRFDSMIHAVSFVQGRGRARQEDSSFVVMAERQDRPVQLLQQVERQQHEIVRNYVPHESNAQDEAKLRVAQISRETGAKSLVLTQQENALQAVLLFAKKTKVVIAESNEGSGSSRTCHMTYTSILRTISVSGSENSVKLARQNAACNLLEALAAQLR